MQQEAFVIEDDDVVVVGEKAAGEGKAENETRAEVMAWVRSLGYQQYETLLIQAGFDSLRAAQHLDDQALQQCGVELVGHRRVLGAAAAALRADRAPAEELEVRQLLLQLQLHQQQAHGCPSPAPSSSASARPAQARTPVSVPRVPSTASAKSATTAAGSSPRGGPRACDSQSPSGQGQRGRQTPPPPPPGPSPTRASRPAEADPNGGGGSGERMRGLFGDLFEPQRMYSPHKPISGGQFASVNDLLGCIVGPDRSPAAAAAAAAAAKPPPRPQQPEPRE